MKGVINRTDHFDSLCDTLAEAHTLSFQAGLENPLFAKLLQFVDKIVFIVNHETFTIDYVSGSIESLLGKSPALFKGKAIDSLSTLVHPQDLQLIQNGFFQTHQQNLSSGSTADILRKKLEYTCRIRHEDGHYLQVLHQSGPIAANEEKIFSSVCVWSEIGSLNNNNRQARTRRFTLQTPAPDIRQKATGEYFSPAEMQILKLTALGFSEKQIAAKLSRSIYTVKTHRKKMFRKAHVANASQLVHFALTHAIIQ